MTTYRTTLLEQAAQLILMLGGSDKVTALLESREGANFKFGQFDFGQLEAILNKLIQAGVADQGVLGQLLRDELEIQLVSAIKKFFAQNGRRIPRGLKANHTDSNRNFHLVQPNLDMVEALALRLVRFQEALQPGLIMSAADFQGKVNELLTALSADEQIANLTSGICLPIIMPQIEKKKFDYGKVLEQTFVAAAKKAYEKEFSGRPFNNYRKDDLFGKVTIIDDSHRRLVERLFQSHLVALYFPNPLQGFSVHADREQMEGLPTTLHLAGGFDTLSAVTMYPDVLGRDFNTPGLDMAALEWQGPGRSLHFGVGDGNAGFGDGAGLGDADARCSGGLVFCLA
ncbi:MAG: hypothetical protein WC310_03250 [Patescibacteria group bacterium]|jgi:hypothetical protein